MDNKNRLISIKKNPTSSGYYHVIKDNGFPSIIYFEDGSWYTAVDKRELVLEDLEGVYWIESKHLK